MKKLKKEKKKRKGKNLKKWFFLTRSCPPPISPWLILTLSARLIRIPFRLQISPPLSHFCRAFPLRDRSSRAWRKPATGAYGSIDIRNIREPL